MRCAGARAAYVLTFLWISAATAQTQPVTEAKGKFDVSFDQRSALSALSVQVQRYGVERSKAQMYETANEKFFVIVPDEYEAAAAGWGLMVWCNASRGGGMPAQLEELLATKRLIGVGAY